MAFVCVCVCVNISISMVGWHIVFLTVLVWAFISDMIGPRWFENLMTWDYPTQTRLCYPCAYIYLFNLTFCICANSPNCGVHEVAQNLCHFLYVIYFYPGVPTGIYTVIQGHEYAIFPRKRFKTTPLIRWHKIHLFYKMLRLKNQVAWSILNLGEFFFVGLSYDSAMALLVDEFDEVGDGFQIAWFCWHPNFAFYFFVSCFRVTRQTSRLVVCPLV